MVLNKKPVEKNRNILSRKGKKIGPTSVENWIKSEDFSAAGPFIPGNHSPPQPQRPEGERPYTERTGEERPCAEMPRGGGEGYGGGGGVVDSISMESMVRRVTSFVRTVLINSGFLEVLSSSGLLIALMLQHMQLT